MSWMDSWSRPSKSQATPAPFYLLPGGDSTPYCQSCGRVIGTRKTTTSAAQQQVIKYCSSRCRSTKTGKLDRQIEEVFVGLLNGDKELEETTGQMGLSKDQGSRKKQKGDPRILVSCEVVEHIVFRRGYQVGEQDDGDTSDMTDSCSEDPATDQPHNHEDAVRCGQDSPNGQVQDVADMEPGSYQDGDVLARMAVRSGTRKRPPQSVSEVNGSVGGEKGHAERMEESEESLEKRKTGQKRAKEREMVRRAARRGVVFGFKVPESTLGDKNRGTGGKRKNKDSVSDVPAAPSDKRKCEAVMQGKVVEPSFAKGSWSVRWRE